MLVGPAKSLPSIKHIIVVALTQSVFQYQFVSHSAHEQVFCPRRFIVEFWMFMREGYLL
jgi:hypothetical protein